MPSTTKGAGGLAQAVSLSAPSDGRRILRKVSGRSRTDVKDMLQAVHDELREDLHTSHVSRPAGRGGLAGKGP